MEESWAQTLITVVPKKHVKNIAHKHKYVELKEIKSGIISANIKETDISQDVFDLQSLNHSPTRHIIDPKELNKAFTKDANNQTFLQGVPAVAIPSKIQHEASQTMYMSSPCPPEQYSQSILHSMSYRMPVFRYNCSTQTAVSFVPATSQHEAARYLLSRTSDEEENLSQINFVDKETIVLEILDFLLSRAFWISDPVLDPVEVMYQETQTVMRYNINTNSVVMDNEVQTKLTCEPSKSNSKLLAEYEETKNFMQSCLQECFKGIESRLIINDLIDVIIMKGADILKYPMKNQTIQTMASYKSREIKEEDVLRKLRIPMVIDPLEASIVVLPLIDDLLCLICEEVSRNARRIIKDILDSSVRRVLLIGCKLAEIRKQSQDSPIEHIFNRRRRQIVKSMLKKETETAATQTGLAGVPEVTKIGEPKEILCSVCARQSMCHSCAANPEDSLFENTKLLRTQDILLAYKPCYIVATASEEARNPHLQPAGLTKKKINELATPQLLTSLSVTPEKTKNVTNKIINLLMIPKKNVRAEDSISGWARIVDDTLAKPWSPKDSVNDEINITSSVGKSISKSCSSQSRSDEIVPNLQAAKALQILKSTFCTRDAYSANFVKMLKERYSSDKGANGEHSSSNSENCTLPRLDQYEQSINNIDCQICARPRADKFR